MHDLLVAGLFVSAFGLMACARIEIRPERSADETGLRFYRPKPYLWVALTDKGACEAKILYLPDTSTTWVIRPRAGIGEIAFKPTLTDGWNLTAFDAEVDTKVAETLGAIGTLIEKAGGVVALGPGGATRVGPGLYALRFDAAGDLDGVKALLRLTGEGGAEVACGAPARGSK